MPKQLRMKVRDVGDVGGLKKSLQGAASNGDYFLRIAADSEITVRFMTEPDGWKEAWLHYDSERKTNRSVICVEDVCEYCADGDRPRKAWFAAVLDVDNGAVRVLQMGTNVVEGVNKRYERYKTLLDRDYIITRTGAGLNDTSYDVDSGDRHKRNMKMYLEEMPDIVEMLESLLPSEEEDDDFEDEKPQRRKAATVKPQRGKPGRRQPEPVDDDDEEYEDDGYEDDEEDDDEEDEPEYAMPARRSSKPVRSTSNDGRAVRKTPPRRMIRG